MILVRATGAARRGIHICTSPDILISLFIRTCDVQARKDLPLAASNGRTQEAVRAIDLGADVDSTLNSYTPLMRSANRGHVDTVAALIVEGADMFATDKRGRTALDWARIARQDKVARMLERAMENEIRYRRYHVAWFNTARGRYENLLAVKRVS